MLYQRNQSCPPINLLSVKGARLICIHSFNIATERQSRTYNIFFCSVNYLWSHSQTSAYQKTTAAISAEAYYEEPKDTSSRMQKIYKQNEKNN